jgi:guanosine-3',5'-bis(diphosphate) 3'-pyrophosphohydrolase
MLHRVGMRLSLRARSTAVSGAAAALASRRRQRTSLRAAWGFSSGAIFLKRRGGGAGKLDAMQAQDMGLVLRAAQFAAIRHRMQRRKDRDATPYINHPLTLADILWREGGVRDARVLAAALLHDTVEDTRTTQGDLAREFGAQVAGVVAEVTDNKRLHKKTRKRLQIEHAPGLSRRAKLVKLADKIANLRDMHLSPPAGWPLLRRREYFDWSRQVVDGLRGTNARLERAFDRAYRRRP